MAAPELPSEAQVIRKMFEDVPASEARPQERLAGDELVGRGGVRVHGNEISGGGGGAQPVSTVDRTFIGLFMANGTLTYYRVDGSPMGPVPS